MSTIFKYPIDIKDEQHVTMSAWSRFLSVGYDPSGQLCVWAEVNPDLKPPIDRTIWIVGTGGEMPFMQQKSRFLGTVLDGDFVWHVFCAD